jgi:hypothetical protein
MGGALVGGSMTIGTGAQADWGDPWAGPWSDPGWGSGLRARIPLEVDDSRMGLLGRNLLLI